MDETTYNLLENNDMTQQAKNSIALYKGNDPHTIEQLLNMQKASVVSELKQHYGVREISELALRLSLG